MYIHTYIYSHIMDRTKLCLRKALYFGLIPPTLVVNQENAAQTCSQANPMEAVP